MGQQAGGILGSDLLGLPTPATILNRPEKWNNFCKSHDTVHLVKREKKKNRERENVSYGNI